MRTSTPRDRWALSLKYYIIIIIIFLFSLTPPPLPPRSCLPCDVLLCPDVFFHISSILHIIFVSTIKFIQIFFFKYQSKILQNRMQCSSSILYILSSVDPGVRACDGGQQTGPQRPPVGGVVPEAQQRHLQQPVVRVPSRHTSTLTVSTSH